MTSGGELPPPQPLPDVDSAPFWQATARDELALCRCQECRHWHQPPLERCRRCAGATAFEAISGAGTVSTFIVQRQGAVVGYLDADDLPYAVALVDLDEDAGLRLPGRIVDIDPDEVAIGMRVQARIVDLAGGDFRVPVFSPVGHPHSRRS